MKDYECSICRESSTVPWQFFVDMGGDNVCIYDANNDGLADAMFMAWREDRSGALMADIYDAFMQARFENMRPGAVAGLKI